MKKVLLIILGILLIGVGGYLIFRPLDAVMTLSWIFAACLLVNGISNIATYFSATTVVKPSGWYLVGAILSIVFAVILIGNAFLRLAVNVTLLYVIAVWFVIAGIVRIVESFDLKKLGAKNWWCFLLLGILFIIAGIMSFANPAALGLTLALLLAINMFICGIDLITLAFVND